MLLQTKSPRGQINTFPQFPAARQRQLPNEYVCTVELDHDLKTFGCSDLGAALLAHDLSPLLHGIGQKIQDLDCVLPADAGIGDADSVLERLLALLGDLLGTCARVD